VGKETSPSRSGPAGHRCNTLAPAFRVYRAQGDALAISSEVQVVVARLDSGPPNTGVLELSLSQAQRGPAARARFDRRRRRFIVARARLRELLAERLDAPPESIEFVYGREGKPALAERFARSGWRFNLSHCGELALYAFSLGRELGIDVEAIGPVDEADA